MAHFKIMPRPICCFIVLLVTACHWDEPAGNDLEFLQTDIGAHFDHANQIHPLPLIDESFVSRFPRRPSSDAIFTTIAHVSGIPAEGMTPESSSILADGAMLAYEPNMSPSGGTQALGQALGVQELPPVESPPIPPSIAIDADAPQFAFSLPIQMETLCLGIGCEGGVNLIGEALMVVDFNMQQVVLNQVNLLNSEMMYHLEGEVILPFDDGNLNAHTLAHAALTLTTPDTIIDSNEAAILIINEVDIHTGFAEIEFESSASDTSFIGSGIAAGDQLQ